MERIINFINANRALEEKGLNQSALATKLEVSREAVSKWFKGSSFPRPDKLLVLGITLGLEYSDLVATKKTGIEPVIAFRKKGTRKTKESHIEKATSMGWMLERLVKYLPYDDLSSPPSLKQPVVEYNYIQRVAKKVRLDIGVNETTPIKYDNLIRKFEEMNSVLIPVMWGTKEHHENALHIYLPSSMTTWIYINLESNIHDFNFWLAHELGHVYSPSLREDEAEDFAEAFAQALLFPKECSEARFIDVLNARTTGIKVNLIKEIANNFKISPITVYKSINNYAEAEGFPPLKIDNIYAAASNTKKELNALSDSLFAGKSPTAKEYLEIAKTLFNSPFFDALKEYLINEDKGPSFVQDILDVPLIDAKSIYEELC